MNEMKEMSPIYQVKFKVKSFDKPIILQSNQKVFDLTKPENITMFKDSDTKFINVEQPVKPVQPVQPVQPAEPNVQSIGLKDINESNTKNLEPLQPLENFKPKNIKNMTPENQIAELDESKKLLNQMNKVIYNNKKLLNQMNQVIYDDKKLINQMRQVK